MRVVLLKKKKEIYFMYRETVSRSINVEIAWLKKKKKKKKRKEEDKNT